MQEALLPAYVSLSAAASMPQLAPGWLGGLEESADQGAREGREALF